MSISFPAALDTFGAPSSSTLLGTPVSGRTHSQIHADLGLAVRALEEAIGVTGTTDVATVRARVDAITATPGADKVVRAGGTGVINAGWIGGIIGAVTGGVLTIAATLGADATLTIPAGGGTAVVQGGEQPVPVEDVAVWQNKASAVAVARCFQAYIAHSGTGGSTAYDAVASTSALSGHSVCYQGVTKATGSATPTFLSFAYGGGISDSSETIPDGYGYYWGGWGGAGTITRKWAFFNAATDKSFFGGDVYCGAKLAIGVSASVVPTWALTINDIAAPVLAWQRAGVDIGYLCNASTVFSGAPNTDLAIAHANTGAVQIGGNGAAMLKVSGTGVGLNGASPVSQAAGFGTPTGASRLSNFPGASASLAQCSGAIADIIAYFKSRGDFGA